MNLRVCVCVMTGASIPREADGNSLNSASTFSFRATSSVLIFVTQLRPSASVMTNRSAWRYPPTSSLTRAGGLT